MRTRCTITVNVTSIGRSGVAGVVERVDSTASSGKSMGIPVPTRGNDAAVTATCPRCICSVGSLRGFSGRIREKRFFPTTSAAVPPPEPFSRMPVKLWGRPSLHSMLTFPRWSTCSIAATSKPWSVLPAGGRSSSQLSSQSNP